MTTNNFIVPESDLQAIENLSMVLISMACAYELPDSVRHAIEDLNDKAETVRCEAMIRNLGLTLIS
jgi:hypothetical protein